jgi:nicotinate phosphoribosyltransferase
VVGVVSGPAPALFVDQYELTMLQAYWRENMEENAVFSLYFRTLPDGWNYALACGLGTVLTYLEELRFTDEDLAYLSGRVEFSDDFVRWLRDFRFTGEVRAVPEGTPVFPNEPILEVRGPIAEAQVIETFVMNQIHLQTVLCSRAERVVRAAGDAAVVDFGMRRMHGIDAAMKGARAFHIAGVQATSNVLAGRALGVPVTGTMAHSFIQAHDSEEEAFRAFVDLYPETILLVDTYDTLDGVRKVVQLAERLGADFSVRGIRLDSGDLGELAIRSREILDEAGLERVRIIASGGLDEYAIRDLRERGAPIDGHGVGTRMGVSVGASVLDIAYKLTEYGGEGRLKLSSGKKILPGPKQVFRVEEDGRDVRDILAGADETHPARPLLEVVMEDGRRSSPSTESHRAGLDDLRRHTTTRVARLPERLRSLESAHPAFPVEVSERLRSRQARAATRLSGG